MILFRINRLPKSKHYLHEDEFYLVKGKSRILESKKRKRENLNKVL